MSLLWPDYRGNAQLSASTNRLPTLSSDLPMYAAEIANLGGGYQEIRIIPDSTGDLLFASGGGIQRYDVTGKLRWRSTPFGAHWIAAITDLDGDGKLEIVTSNGAEVIILNADSGVILWRRNVALPHSYGTYGGMLQIGHFIPSAQGQQIIVPCFSTKDIPVFDCSDGAAATHLAYTLSMPDAYHPTVVIGDVNADGLGEFVITRLGGIYIFEPERGEMIGMTQWNSDEMRRRNYGLLLLDDLDNDGELEIAILSDRVTRHIAVLDNNGSGSFTLLWDRFLEHIYPLDQMELRYVAGSLCDINSDGLFEIVVSIFGEEGPHWKTEVLRAATGETVLQVGQSRIEGILPRGTMLLSSQSERTISDYSMLSLVNAEGQLQWSRDEARPAVRQVNATYTASQFKPEIFGNDGVWTSGDEFYYFTRNGELEEFWLSGSDSRMIAGGLTGSPRISATHQGKIYLSHADGRISVIDESTGDRCEFAQLGYHLTTEAHIAARPAPIVTAAETKEGLAILSPDYSGSIRIISNDTALKISGVSRRGYDNVYHAASLIEYDSEPHVIVIPLGTQHGALQVFDLNGNLKRTYDFPAIPPAAINTRIGIYDWRLFEHSTGPAMYIAWYRSPSMNSEASMAIRLSDGAALWSRSEIGDGEHGRGFGPWGASSLSHDGRTLAFCAKDTLCLIDTESGEFLQPPQLLTDCTTEAMKSLGVYHEQGFETWSTVLDPFTAYGSVIWLRLNGNPALLVSGCFGGFGMLTEQGGLLWWKVSSFGDVMYRMPALLPLPSRVVIGVGHADGWLRFYDASTGETSGSLYLGGVTTDSMAVEYDGAPALLTSISDGRVVIAGFDGSAPRILFSKFLGSALGSPVAFAARGDVAANIYVATGDGKLVIIAP